MWVLQHSDVLLFTGNIRLTLGYVQANTGQCLTFVSGSPMANARQPQPPRISPHTNHYLLCCPGDRSTSSRGAETLNPLSTFIRQEDFPTRTEHGIPRKSNV